MSEMKDLCLRFLRESHAVSVFFDVGDGVIVPEQFAGQSMRLDIGLNLPRPIPGLCVDYLGVSGEFSFGGQPQYCFVPWDAVTMLRGDSGTWVRSDVAAQASAPKAPPHYRPEDVITRRGHLTLLRGGKSAPATPPKTA